MLILGDESVSGRCRCASAAGRTGAVTVSDFANMISTEVQEKDQMKIRPACGPAAGRDGINNKVLQKEVLSKNYSG